jgi:hypothetical protein
MSQAKCTEAQFIEAWQRLQSPQKVADELGVAIRNVYSRRRAIEASRGVKLDATDEPRRAAKPDAETPLIVDLGPVKRLPSHLVIPDVQARPGVPFQHLDWIGRYIVAEKPDVIVCIGDFADMPSLSMYDVGKTSAEGRRYKDDIKAAHEAMTRLLAPLRAYNEAQQKAGLPLYLPRMVMCYGNHEYRIVRAADNDPKFSSTIDLSDLKYKEFGWEVYQFLEIVVIDGIEYSHYFTSGDMGRPVTSSAALLRERCRTAVMGHIQRTDIAHHKKKNYFGLFAGTCYLHNEKYLGPQGNCQRRQIWMFRRVDDGVCDIEQISLAALRERYA